jgi:hypothetical protein
MSSDLDQYDQPLRRFPVHWAATLMATASTLALQFVWPIIASRPPAHSWWPVDAFVVVSATAYLLSVAWMHVRAVCWRPNELVPRLWQLGHGALCDGLIATLAIVGVLRGPETGLLRSGLWLVAPVLLTASAVSLVVTALALRDGLQRFWTDVPPANAPYGKPRGIGIRSLGAAVLFFSLILLDSTEPQVKPWEQVNPPATATTSR